MFIGLYLLHEEVNEDFLLARVKDDDGQGDFMKLNGGVYLHYFGSDVTWYANQTGGDCLGE